MTVSWVNHKFLRLLLVSSVEKCLQISQLLRERLVWVKSLDLPVGAYRLEELPGLTHVAAEVPINTPVESEQKARKRQPWLEGFSAHLCFI
jgi:hypothetical protein